jgi:hypothetical protein
MSEEPSPSEEPEEKVARADRDRFGPLGPRLPDPDRACLTCVVVVLIAVLVFIGCLVFYYRSNDVFRAP